jgi:hypothetical protein
MDIDIAKSREICILHRVKFNQLIVNALRQTKTAHHKYLFHKVCVTRLAKSNNRQLAFQVSNSNHQSVVVWMMTVSGRDKTKCISREAKRQIFAY